MHAPVETVELACPVVSGTAAPPPINYAFSGLEKKNQTMCCGHTAASRAASASARVFVSGHTSQCQ